MNEGKARETMQKGEKASALLRNEILIEAFQLGEGDWLPTVDIVMDELEDSDDFPKLVLHVDLGKVALLGGLGPLHSQTDVATRLGMGARALLMRLGCDGADRIP